MEKTPPVKPVVTKKKRKIEQEDNDNDNDQASPKKQQKVGSPHSTDKFTNFGLFHENKYPRSLA